MILNPTDKPENRYSLARGPNGNPYVCSTDKPHLIHSIQAFMMADYAPAGAKDVLRRIAKQQRFALQ